MRVRTWRRLTAALISVALLSMQWAAAAHACEALSRSAGGAPRYVSGCAGAHVAPMQGTQLLPCAAHCTSDDQSSAGASVDCAAIASYFLRAWFATEWPDPQRHDRAMSLAVDTGPPAGTPPIYLSQVSLLN